MDLPQSYVIDKIYSYSSKLREYRTYLNGCCPICREGKSWGKKTRLFYFLNEDYFFCHNCNRSWTPYMWIKEASGMSFKEIKEELKDYDHDIQYKLMVDSIEERHFELPVLPGECVNLKDDLQLKYFRTHAVVEIARRYCADRRLFTAINAPKTFYCCLNDKYHGNRLVIPFFNEKGKIDSYISRKLLDSDNKAKYLMKFGSNKPIFNLAKVDADYPYLFLFEGQIDSMFVKNGIALAGVYLTPDQDEELTHSFPFHQRIWVLDNYRFEEKEVRSIIIDKLKNNETLFLYDGDFAPFKDLNEYCTKKGQDFVDPALILKGCYSGDKGILKIS